MPNIAGLFRLDQLIAAWRASTLWLTDAYFVGHRALRAGAARGRARWRRRAAAGAGRERHSVLRPLSRAGYRPLLEAGVRVFEWNGSMLHAKTAVADARWARVGSTNLNIASWLGNYELDVAIEDEGFARAWRRCTSRTSSSSTEIVLARRNRVRPSQRAERRGWRPRSKGRPAGRAAAGALSLGSAVGAAIKDHRVLGPAEARVLGVGGLVLLADGGDGRALAARRGLSPGRDLRLARLEPSRARVATLDAWPRVRVQKVTPGRNSARHPQVPNRPIPLNPRRLQSRHARHSSCLDRGCAATYRR